MAHDWKKERDLEEGGQAHTFIVHDANGDASIQYVMKRLKNVKRLNRFKTEIAAIEQLDHPHVIKIVDKRIIEPTDEVPKPKDRSYIVMEYHSQGNLTTIKDRLAKDPILALTLFIQVCDALGWAHAHNIIHRDIKPENILLRGPEGPAVVSDFGICYMEDGERLTLTDEVVGSWFCTPPELARGRADSVLPKSDVYCLGKLLYWMVSGGRDFYREGFRSVRDNLVEITNNLRMESINQLLDKTVVEDQHERYSDATTVKTVAKMVLETLRRPYNVVTSKVLQPCLYCGRGIYYQRYMLASEQQSQGAATVTRYFPGNPQFLVSVGLSDQALDMRIFVCNYCGHIQYFSLADAEVKERWNR